MIRPGQARGPYVGAQAGGTPASLTTIPTWIGFNFAYTDFAFAALNYAALLYSLPAGGHVTGAMVKTTTLFTGPGSASAQVSVGLGSFGSALNDNNNGRFSIRAVTSGTAFNTKTLAITNTVLAGAETVTWAANTLVIEVQAGVSTVAQVLAAVPVGTPWAILALSTAGTVDALAATAMSGLNSYVAGTAGDLERIIPLFDVQQAVADTTGQPVNIGDWVNQGAATALQVQLAVTGANLNTLTQGAGIIWLLLSKAVTAP